MQQAFDPSVVGFVTAESIVSFKILLVLAVHNRIAKLKTDRACCIPSCSEQLLVRPW